MNDPIPAIYVKTKCGYVESGPPLKIELDDSTGEKDVVVIYLEDCQETGRNILKEKSVAEIVDTMQKLAKKEYNVEPKDRAVKSYCFNVADASTLCVELLFALRKCGDRFADKLIERFDEIRQELDIEDSAANGDED